MKRIFSGACLSCVAGTSLLISFTGCEQHSWEKTQVLYHDHGGDHHAEGEEAHGPTADGHGPEHGDAENVKGGDAHAGGAVVVPDEQPPEGRRVFTE